jgi:hypothetical protein
MLIILGQQNDDATASADRRPELELCSSIAEVQISRALYERAGNRNRELAKVERMLLFSRCDRLGNALAYPDSLIPAQLNMILVRPSPDMLANIIKQVSGQHILWPRHLRARGGMTARLAVGRTRTVSTVDG